MGITGELVRSVFSKSHSIPRHGSEKRKWSRSVRSYLCGDEHSSILVAQAEEEEEAEFDSFRSNVATNKSRDVSVGEESASVRSSEATVEQPLPLPLPLHERSDENITKDKLEDAAFIIQSAFRNFMGRRRGAGSPSIGTSVEVQTAHSCKGERDDEARRGISRRTQLLKTQEEWDDSTVSSVISKMRMQNRMEAATRRERALAYAFSQQLRICSKKHGSSDEGKMGWSWLERWMAARQGQPEMNLFQDTPKPMAMDEKESCGSNDLSSLVEYSKPRALPKRSFSRHTSTFSTPKDSKDVKKAWHINVEEHKEKRKRQKQPGVTKRDATTSIIA